MLEQLLEKYPQQVKLVLKHFPLKQHSAARAAARAALAASQQGKYVELSDLMFADYKSLNDERIEAYARQVGLDMTRFAQAIDSAEVRQIIRQDIELGRRIRIPGVPALYLNGRAVKDYSLQGMAKMIEKAISKKAD